MSASGQPARYEVRVEGLLDSHWAAWLEGLHLSNDGTQTVISGPLADQPALHRLLAKIRDLGLCLISVRRLDSGDAGDGAPLLDPIRIPSLGHAPAGALRAMRERVLAAVILLTALMTVVFDTTIVNVAISTLSHDFHAPVSTIQ